MSYPGGGEADVLIPPASLDNDGDDFNNEPEYVIIKLDEPAPLFHQRLPKDEVAVAPEDEKPSLDSFSSVVYQGTKHIVHFSRPGSYGQDLVALNGSPIPIANPNAGNHRYVCRHPYCNYSSPRINNYNRHVKSTHGRRDHVSNPWTCCEIVLNNLGELNLHKALAHIADMEGDNLVYFCRYCHFSARRKPDLSRHAKKHFPGSGVVCPMEGCGYNSNSKSNVTRHLESCSKKRGGGMTTTTVKKRKITTMDYVQYNPEVQNGVVTVGGMVYEEEEGYSVMPVAPAASSVVALQQNDVWYHHHQQQPGPSSSSASDGGFVQMSSPPPSMGEQGSGMEWELHQPPPPLAFAAVSSAEFEFKQSVDYQELDVDLQRGSSTTSSEEAEDMMGDFGIFGGREAREIDAFLDSLDLELPELGNIANLPF